MTANTSRPVTMRAIGMMRRGREVRLLSAVATLWVAPMASAQVGAGQDETRLTPVALSLEEAIALALEGNADLQVARASREMARASASEAAAVYWPRLDLESGFVRSVDPVFAFGTKLRQERFAEVDFDPAGLNQPDPINDWVNAVSAEWKVFSPADWTGRAAASQRADAARWSEARATEGTVFHAEALYLEAQRTAAQHRAAVEAEAAARSARDGFARRVEEGVLTEAELLQAEADLAAAQASRIEAIRAEQDARRRLAVFLGWGPERLPLLTDTLTLDLGDRSEPLSASEPVNGFEPELRADLRALSAVRGAAEADRKRTTMTYLPEIGVFGAYSIHGQDPFQADGDNWTVGVGLRWNLFSGLGRSADAERAAAARQIAETRYHSALREASAQVAEAREAVSAARRAVEASVAGERAAQAGAVLMRRRFEEGLATPTDLLTTEARAAGARSRAIDAVAGHRLAEARFRFVTTLHSGETD